MFFITKDRYLLKIKDFGSCLQYTYSKVIDKNNNKKKKNNSLSSVNKAESLRCSISRSISNIKELCFCNNFEYFFTLTVKDNKRNDILFSCNLINGSVKEYARTRKHFKYLYVFEKQKAGGIHIHGFFSGFDDLYYNKYGHLSSLFFDKIGFQNFIVVDKVNPFYLIKYISKEPIKELKHRYFRSRNLKKADTSYLHCNFDEFSNFGFTFKNKYCKMITVSK